MGVIKEQKDWIKSGKIGCVFASALVKQAEKIGWKFYLKENAIDYRQDISDGKVFIASIIYPGMTAKEVKEHALNSGMYIENINDMYEGLRVSFGNGNISWVQYFGLDSHVKTRQSPHPMLSFAIKLPTHVYAKTMAKGIFHLAHASIEFLTAKKCDTLWEQSYSKTKKELGYSPTIRESAKVTFVK